MATETTSKRSPHQRYVATDPPHSGQVSAPAATVVPHRRHSEYIATPCDSSSFVCGSGVDDGISHDGTFMLPIEYYTKALLTAARSNISPTPDASAIGQRYRSVRFARSHRVRQVGGVPEDSTHSVDRCVGRSRLTRLGAGGCWCPVRCRDGAQRPQQRRRLGRHR